MASRIYFAGTLSLEQGTFICSRAGTPDLIHMLIHLLQLGSHVWTAHIVGMPHMIYTQVMPNQQVPLVRLPHAWHQILCMMAKVKACSHFWLLYTILQESSGDTRAVSTVRDIAAHEQSRGACLLAALRSLQHRVQ